MAKRQLRLSSPKDIASKLAEISGKKVNIVLKSGSVLFVEIAGADGSTLRLINMRQKRSSLDVNEISEIILDID